MANVKRLGGFIPLEQTDMRLGMAMVDGSAGQICKGDLIVLENDGYCTRATAGSNAAVIGVASHFEDENGYPLLYMPASTTAGRKVYYYPALLQEFRIQCYTGTAFTQTMINNCFDIQDAAGDTTTGMSKQTLLISSAANQCRVMGLFQKNDNALGDMAEVIVRIVEQAITDTTSI